MRVSQNTINVQQLFSHSGHFVGLHNNGTSNRCGTAPMPEGVSDRSSVPGVHTVRSQAVHDDSSFFENMGKKRVSCLNRFDGH